MREIGVRSPVGTKPQTNISYTRADDYFAILTDVVFQPLWFMCGFKRQPLCCREDTRQLEENLKKLLISHYVNEKDGNCRHFQAHSPKIT